jgi:hypothetical protein
MFSMQLIDISKELRRLRIAKMIPDHFAGDKKVIHANAVAVLEAVLLLVGQQLAYFATKLWKLGLPPCCGANLRPHCHKCVNAHSEPVPR